MTAAYSAHSPTPCSHTVLPHRAPTPCCASAQDGRAVPPRPGTGRRSARRRIKRLAYHRSDMLLGCSLEDVRSLTLCQVPTKVRPALSQSIFLFACHSYKAATKGSTNGLHTGRRWFRACRNVSLSRVLLRPQCRQVSLDVGVGRVFGRQNGRQKPRFRRVVSRYPPLFAYIRAVEIAWICEVELFAIACTHSPGWVSRLVSINGIPQICRPVRQNGKDLTRALQFNGYG
jgi:hypothetical protein